MEKYLLIVYPTVMKNHKLCFSCCLLSSRSLQSLSKVLCSSKQSLSDQAFSESEAAAQEGTFSFNDELSFSGSLTYAFF